MQYKTMDIVTRKLLFTAFEPLCHMSGKGKYDTNNVHFSLLGKHGFASLVIHQLIVKFLTKLTSISSEAIRANASGHPTVLVTRTAIHTDHVTITDYKWTQLDI